MKILLLISVLCLTASCISGTDCQTDALAASVRCSSNEDCANNFDNTYICMDTSNYIIKPMENGCQVVITPKGSYCGGPAPTQQCVKDLCNYGNVDCGFGTCKLDLSYIGESDYSCDCDSGYLKKINPVEKSETCIVNSCTTSADCENTEIKTGSYYSTETPVCSQEGKCVEN